MRVGSKTVSCNLRVTSLLSSSSSIQYESCGSCLIWKFFFSVILLVRVYVKGVGGGGGGGSRGFEFPASRTLYSRFQPLSLVVPAFECIFCCEKLGNVEKFFSYFSQLPPPWIFYLQPCLRPPPVDIPPPFPSGPHPLFPSTFK